MSKKWLYIGSFAIVAGVALFVIAFVALESFWEGLFIEIGGIAVSLGIVVLLIDGPLLSRERRRLKVISMAARSVAQLNEEITLMMVREIGEYLASRLDSNIDLYGDERGDWKAFKPLLRLIFQDAKEVPKKGLPQINASLIEEEYQGYIKGVSSLLEKIRFILGSDWEVQAQLLGLVEHLNKLNNCIAKANYPSTIREEGMRYEALGDIGNAIIDLIEATPKIKD